VSALDWLRLGVLLVGATVIASVFVAGAWAYIVLLSNLPF
jgi:hypothetical protein